MALNLSSWYLGKIGLEDKVIDLSNFEIRQKTTEKDLQKYYEECITKLNNSEYFENQSALKKTLEECLNSKRIKLNARDPIYPGLFNYKHQSKVFEHLLDPTKIEKSKYFYVPHCLLRIPLHEDSPFRKLSDKDNENIIKKDEKFEPAIEIPNDRTQLETKALTYHETLHYIIVNYQLNSGRLLTKDDSNLSKKDRNLAEHFIQERVVEELTDVLLEDDKEALFEHRWQYYKMQDPKTYLIKLGSVPTTFLAVWGIANPKLLPLSLISILTTKLIYNKYKNSKRELLVKHIDRNKFKI